MSTHDEEYRERGRAAVDLAVAAARLRDTDDALVAFGREFGDDYRSMPDDDQIDRGLELTQRVADAYSDMRAAETKFYVVGGAAMSDGDGFVRVEQPSIDRPPTFRGGSGPEERL